MRSIGTMSGNWSWELLDAQRHPVTDTAAGGTFPSQSEAESWLGVDAVTLREGDAVVYGPMSLQPME